MPKLFLICECIFVYLKNPSNIPNPFNLMKAWYVSKDFNQIEMLNLGFQTGLYSNLKKKIE